MTDTRSVNVIFLKCRKATKRKKFLYLQLHASKLLLTTSDLSLCESRNEECKIENFQTCPRKGQPISFTNSRNASVCFLNI